MRSLLGLLLTTFLASSVQAQTGRVDAAPDAAAKGKEKEMLLHLLDDAQALARWMPNESPFLAVVGQVHEQIAGVEASELSSLRDFEPHLGHLEATLARMRERVGSVQAATELCDPARHADLFLLLLDTLDAEGQRGVTAKICEKLAAQEGAPEILSRVRVAADLAFTAARSMHDLVLLCDPTLDPAKADSAHYAELRSDLAGMNAGVQESVRSAKRDLTQAMTIVAGHVSEVTLANTSSLQGTLREDRDHALRLEIEKVLDEGKPYAAFYLPEAFGGQLETVRKVLMETIQNVLASGGSENGANQKVVAADTQFTHGHYRKAFKLYSEAYQAVVGAAEAPQ